MTLATRMAVMDRGRIVQVGTPSEVYEFPATRFTADFIGSINIFEGRVERVEADGVVVATPRLSCGLEIAGRWEVTQGQSVWVAIRPEKIRVEPQSESDNPADVRNTARGIVRDVAYLGDSSIYRVEVADGVLIEVTQPNLTRSIERRIDWDDAVVVSWSAEAGLILSE